jgi:hypothetical protein
LPLVLVRKSLGIKIIPACSLRPARHKGNPIHGGCHESPENPCLRDALLQYSFGSPNSKI